MSSVLSLVGRTASGKTTIAKKLAIYLRTSHIECSDLMRGNSTRPSRQQLAEQTSKQIALDPDWFGKQLAAVIETKMQERGRRIIVVSGIRQMETVRYLKKHYDYYGFEVRSDVPIRLFRSLGDMKYDTIDQFIRGEIRELDMGIREVEDDAPFAIPTSPDTDPDKLVTAAVKLLRERNVELR